MNKIIEINIKNAEIKRNVFDIYDGRKVTAEISSKAKEITSEVKGFQSHLNFGYNET